MITLALDTATPRGALALLRDGELLDEQFFSRIGGEDLFTALERLCLAQRVTPREVDLIGVGLGPGSFTGVRGGIAAAKGLALPGRLPIVGVNSFDALALTALPQLPAEVAELCVFADARREEICCAFYDRDGARRGDVQIRALESLADQLHDPVWFVSWEIDRYRGPLRELFGGFAVLPAAPVFPSATAIGRLARRQFHAGNQEGDTDLEPCYLRQTAYRTAASTSEPIQPSLPKESPS